MTNTQCRTKIVDKAVEYDGLTLYAGVSPGQRAIVPETALQEGAALSSRKRAFITAALSSNVPNLAL